MCEIRLFFKIMLQRYGFFVEHTKLFFEKVRGNGEKVHFYALFMLYNRELVPSSMPSAVKTYINQ